MPAYTLFGQPANPSTITSDNGPYTLGVQFSVSAGLTLTAIWMWSPVGAGTTPATIGLYQVTGVGTGTLVHSEAATWSGPAGSGWIRAAFANPPSLTPGTKYKAVIFNSLGTTVYGGTNGYWNPPGGPGGNGLTNGPLSAPNNPGADIGQDSFNSGSPIGYPASTFNAANYWIDPEVTASAGGTPDRHHRPMWGPR